PYTTLFRSDDVAAYRVERQVGGRDVARADVAGHRLGDREVRGGVDHDVAAHGFGTHLAGDTGNSHVSRHRLHRNRGRRRHGDLVVHRTAPLAVRSARVRRAHLDAIADLRHLHAQILEQPARLVRIAVPHPLDGLDAHLIAGPRGDPHVARNLCEIERAVFADRVGGGEPIRLFPALTRLLGAFEPGDAWGL